MAKLSTQNQSMVQRQHFLSLAKMFKRRVSKNTAVGFTSVHRFRRVQQFDGGSEQNAVSIKQRRRVIGSISVQRIRVLEVLVLHPPHRVLQQLDGRH